MTAIGPSPPTPPSPSPAPVCPICHAPVLPSARFCPACGTALSSAPAPGAATASAPPVDIRQQVDADRGILKKIQLLVPGFRGYRQGEDLREADSVLRLQIADRLHTAVGLLTQRRQNLATSGHFDGLTDLAMAIADLTRLEGEIRHAEQGYTGISPALRVTPKGQDQLYEYDYGFAVAAHDVVEAANVLADPAADLSKSGVQIANIRTLVTRLEQAFRARIQTIQNVRVP